MHSTTIQYSLDGLDRAITQAEKNIQTFEDAIEVEQNNVRSFRKMKSEVERKESERQSKEAFVTKLVTKEEDTKDGSKN